MAHQQVPVLKKEYLDMIPEFSGEPEKLSRFIAITEKIINRFLNMAEPDDFQNEFLFFSILAKIKGPAAQLLESNRTTTWLELKNALINGYSDKRDCFTLTKEISDLKQNHNETPFEYFDKLNKLIATQVAFFQNHYESAEEAAHLINFSRQYALRIFLKGLKDPIGSLLITKNPKDLSEALSMLTNDFQFDRTNNMFKHQQNQPNRQNNNHKFNTRPQTYNNYRYPTDNIPRHNPFQNYHQRQLVPARPTSNAPQHFNYPNNNVRPRFPTQTPMSVSTRNSTPRPQHRQHYNVPYSRNFNTIPELHNIEENPSNSSPTVHFPDEHIEDFPDSPTARAEQTVKDPNDPSFLDPSPFSPSTT